MAQGTLQAPTDGWPAIGPLPDGMRAVAFARFGSPEVLEPTDWPTPRPGVGEVVVRVAAVSVGRLLDLSARAGTHPYARFHLPHILGAEHAGVVAAVGAKVNHVEVGDRVAVFPVLSCDACEACLAGASEACPGLEILGVHRQGAYAEYSCVPASNVTVVPPDLSPADAAALALAGPVAMHQLTTAGLRHGDWVLVQGAASALGSLTANLAAHLGGRVIATSRVAWKRQRLVDLGATAALDPTDKHFVEQVLERTQGRGVAIAVDDLGEPSIWSRTLECLATRGTVVSSGAFLGGQVTVDLLRLYSRCQRVVGVRTGNAASSARLWGEVRAGFRPVIDRIFPIRQAPHAHQFLETEANLGRVVLGTADGDWA